MLLNTWSNFICTPYYVERYEKLVIFQPESGPATAVTDSGWNSLIKEIIIDKKKLHLYNEYTEVSYES